MASFWDLIGPENNTTPHPERTRGSSRGATFIPRCSLPGSFDHGSALRAMASALVSVPLRRLLLVDRCVRVRVRGSRVHSPLASPPGSQPSRLPVGSPMRVLVPIVAVFRCAAHGTPLCARVSTRRACFDGARRTVRFRPGPQKSGTSCNSRLFAGRRPHLARKRALARACAAAV